MPAVNPSYRSHWTLRPDVTFLNHGSFGLVPIPVQAARAEWQRRLYEDPVDFYIRQVEEALSTTAQKLGKFINADPRDLLLVDNATMAMNIVAQSTPLAPGDEVLLTNHEYGAVRRIWQKRCDAVGAKVVVQALPEPLQSQEDVAQRLMARANSRTRLIVISHLTSPTATILPAKRICELANREKIPVCIDGPHALAFLPLDLKELGCDFYCASCHKWLSAANGSGFLYVSKKRQSQLAPVVVSWGGSLEGRPWTWQDEYNWMGTSDSTSRLTIGPAIDFLQQLGIAEFRHHSHALAEQARVEIEKLTGQPSLVPPTSEWFGPMISMPLPLQGLTAPPQGKRDPLQDWLWDNHQIEVPITWWQGHRLLRVSCHLYTDSDDIAKLSQALRERL